MAVCDPLKGESEQDSSSASQLVLLLLRKWLLYGE